MTFYNETVLRLIQEVYPKAQLTQQVIRAKQFIDTRAAEPIDLDAMAAEAFYSKFYFIRCFKALYGKTPYQHLITVRITKAKQLLLSDSTVAEVCYSVGFDSVSSFVGLFKKMTGMTPTTYRKKQFWRTMSTHCR